MFTQPSGVIVVLIVTQSQSCSFIEVVKKQQHQAISEVHVHIQFKCGTNSVATNTVWSYRDGVG